MVRQQGQLMRRERGGKAVAAKHSRCSAVDIWVWAATRCETDLKMI